MSSRSSCSEIFSWSHTSRAGGRLLGLLLVRAGKAAVGDARERLAAVALDDRVEPLARLGRELGRPGDARVRPVAQRPRDHETGDRIARAEDATGVLGLGHLAVPAEVALDVPRDVVGDP